MTTRGLAEQIDAYVKRAMAAWPDQPAVGVAVVRDGRAVLTRGYGVRRQGQAQRADEHTLFAIASNTKNVTAAALAILVDEGKVNWDEPVRTYLPGFTLSDPVIGERITVRDLLSHRAGFGLGAGDLLFWPDSDRTRAEVLAAVPQVPIEDGFRARYHYCNLMFVVAGAVIEQVSGQAWEDFVQSRILDRVGMTETVPLMTRADPAKSALPHGRVGPPLRYQGPMTVLAESIADIWNWDSAAAAGGFCTTTTDWAKWIAVCLAEGELPDGTRLFSQAAARELWRPNIIAGSSPGPTAELPGRAIASTSAMGWQVQDYRGERMVTHGGGSPGGISATVLIRAARPASPSSPTPRRASCCARFARAWPTSSWARPVSTGSPIPSGWRPRATRNPWPPRSRSTPSSARARRRPWRWTPMWGRGRTPGTVTSSCRGAARGCGWPSAARRR